MTTIQQLGKFLEMRDADPDVAGPYWSGGPVEVADSTWYTSQFAGVTVFDTQDGLVLVDTGIAPTAAFLAQAVRDVTDKPVAAAVYTHGHVDHAYGLDRFLLEDQAPPRVIAHGNMAERFARYERTSGHNNAINVRQFGGVVPDGSADLFHAPPVMPTEYYEGAGTELTVGDLRLELHHGRGETDDHTWIWCAERGVVCTGDLFIWCVPNGGNPQKVQRYPWDWAAALREMARLEPETLCPGHGGPVVRDPARIRHMLESTAEFLESIVEQTLDALNAGSPPHADIVHAVKIPEMTLPWLQPVYDDPEFLVRSVIRYYGGWWNGRPSDLKPAPRDALATELAALAGGVEVLAQRAKELAAAGELRLAGHLADLALEADPRAPESQDAVSDVYSRRSEVETSLMASNIFSAAVAYATAGRAFA